jgi:dinuclear metal center YbgI/SA1388 family protein
MKLSEIVAALNELAPPAYQESYDNAGLMVGNMQDNINLALLAIDVTEEVMNEAIKKKANLIIAHHPVIFSPLKSITGKTPSERVILSAIRENIAIFCIHTNLDNIAAGVNQMLAGKLGLINPRILLPMAGELRKLVTFVPADYAEIVRTAIFNAGAGHIGNYDQCSYNIEGTGSFRGSEDTNPFVGEKGKLHFEKEIRIETIFPRAIQSSVVKSLLDAHPYEEPAYDIYPLDNEYSKLGSGMIGSLGKAMPASEFLNFTKERLGCQMLRYSGNITTKIKNVACCGGSGAFLIPQAIKAGADAFITADIKYHQFLDAPKDFLLIDAGHYETEQFTKEIFYEFLIKKFPNFALRFSKVNTNPIKYL